MDEKKGLKLNVIAPFIAKLVGIIGAFILPRLFIASYGSATNGLITSITNFLSIITLLDMGIGAVVQSSFYQPLVDGDTRRLSQVYIGGRRFFRTISLIFLGYTIVLAFLYPIFSGYRGSSFSVTILIFVIAARVYAESYLNCTDALLLTAGKRAYIPQFINMGCAAWRIAVCCIFIKLGFSVQVVEAIALIGFACKPIVLSSVIKKHYIIDKKTSLDGEPLKQKWNGIAQHLAFYVTFNTDVIVLTLFSSLENVSVYSVNNMIPLGISGVIIALQVGVQPILGEAYAGKNDEKLKRAFEVYEWINYLFSTIAFACTLVLLKPFVAVYTAGLTDATYIQPVFSVIIILAMYAYTIRFPYHTLVIAAGHFRQTQWSSIVEMVLNLTISLILVRPLGLVGVAIGTLVSLLYRTTYLIWYGQRLIKGYSILSSITIGFASILSLAVCYGVCSFIDMAANNYLDLLFLAVKVLVIAILISSGLLIIVRKDRATAAFSLIHKKGEEK